MRPFRLLLVDENPEDRARVLEILDRGRDLCEACEAGNADSLARALETARWDLIVVDQRLAWADGLALGSILRERDPDCPLLLLSRADTLEAGVAALRAGFDGCVPKAPLRPDRLAKAAAQLLEEARARKREAWAETRLQDVLSRLEVGVYRATSRGIMLYANAAFCRIFGIPSWREAPAWSLRAALADPSEEGRLARDLKRTGFLQGVELRLKGPNGRDQWISLTQSLRPGGESLGVIEGLVEDITERKLQALAAKRREEELQSHRRLEAVGQLAGGVAHDFNNLLTTINGYGDLLHAQLPAGSPQAESAREIRTAGLRAAHLTRQLLAFGSRLLLQPKRLCLNTFLRRLERTIQDALGESVRLRVTVQAELEPVYADPVQLESVVMGLVLNARDAMPHGGVLALRTATIRVEEKQGPADGAAGEGLRPGAYALLMFEDTGMGMSREVLARIFEPFFTTKPTSADPARRVPAGLGLSTAYGILRQSGGSIHANSEPGKGSRFRLYIPQVREWRAPEPHPGDTGAGPEPTGLRA